MLKDRFDHVEDRIQAACARAGRHRDSVTLIAVTKIFPAAIVVDAYSLGQRHFGENYVQEFAGKAPDLTTLDGARFHLIGHLQSNKAKTAAELFQTIQTIDTPKLAQRLGAADRKLDVMIEVKLSDHEESKNGTDPQDIAALIEAVRGQSNLALLGLMTIPPWSEDAETSRPYFVRLRELAAQHGLLQLSMGMSNDFEVAIEEGSTMVRLGTALFGPRKRA